MICENADKDHLWNRNAYRFQFDKVKDKEKATAFSEMIFKSFNVPEEDRKKKKKNFYIAYHHFSLPFLKNNSILFNFVQKEILQEVDNDPTDRTTDHVCNKYLVTTLLGKKYLDSLQDARRSELKGLYVKPALCSYENAKSKLSATRKGQLYAN